MPGLYQLHTTLETAAGDWRAGDRVMTTTGEGGNALPPNSSL